MQIYKKLFPNRSVSLLVYFLLLMLHSGILPCDQFKDFSLPPKDESDKDKSFLEFKTKLIQAVQKKDAEFLKSAIDKDIKFSFGEESGKKRFLESWELDKKPKQSGIWTSLENTFKLGFSKDNDGFSSPYLFNHFPNDYDAFSYSLISGTNVNVRAEASIKSKVVTKLSHKIVFLDRDSNENDAEGSSDQCVWQKVCLANGETGFVCDQYLRSPVDYRAIFAKKNNKWAMVVFIAGD
ncbi:SH3 domain-containing protein [Leptospira sp. 'Mane']|uniref:SH3 domain-containing protein n=1 Tax=Leptospira sp. 'Mane' TaxID=3387407 RepID=UPI00398AFD5D